MFQIMSHKKYVQFLLAAALGLSGCATENADQSALDEKSTSASADLQPTNSPSVNSKPTNPKPVTAQPTAPVDHAAQAKAHLRAGQLTEAEAACLAGIEANPQALDLYNLLATVHASGGRYALAIEALDKALVQDPDFALGHLNLGGIYTKLGKFDQAETHLQEALRLRPDESSLRRRLGELYLQTQRFDQAAANLHLALELLPQDATLYFYLGQALEGQNQMPASLAAFQQSTHLDIGFSDAYYRLAGVARKNKEPELARAALQHYQHLQSIGGGDANIPKQMRRLRAAILAAPEDAPHHLRLGFFFLSHDYVDQALNKFSRAFSLAPPTPAQLNRVGGALLAKEYQAQALDYYRQAVRLDSSYLPALVNAGSLLSLDKHHSEALAHFRQALAIAPDNPQAHYYCALGFYHINAYDRARDTLEAGLRLPRLKPQLQNQMRQLLATLPPAPQ
jgi:tetratricopeptide (TPR) repeat protein